MKDIFIPADYEVVRNPDLCIACRVCERQCANEVHRYDKDLGKMNCRQQQVRKLPQVRLYVPHARVEDSKERRHLQSEL